MYDMMQGLHPSPVHLWWGLYVTSKFWRYIQPPSEMNGWYICRDYWIRVIIFKKYVHSDQSKFTYIAFIVVGLLNSRTTISLVSSKIITVAVLAISRLWCDAGFRNWRINFVRVLFFVEQGKSEGFESCDQPIVRKRAIWVKIGDVFYRVTLKFDGWPWKTIGHLSFAVSSFVQQFIAIGEFKLELQSRNAQFGSNSKIFRAVWPWNLTYDLEKQ